MGHASTDVRSVEHSPPRKPSPTSGNRAVVSDTARAIDLIHVLQLCFIDVPSLQSASPFPSSRQTSNAHQTRDEKTRLRFIRAPRSSFARLYDVHRYLIAIVIVFALANTHRADAKSSDGKAPFQTQGIYVRQATAQTRAKLDHLINNSLQVGVNTMVVDLWTPSTQYERAIEKIQKHGIRYVPRITVFPKGGTHEQVSNRQYWEKRWKLAEYALRLGAKDVQLDYIRYSSKTEASPQNALNIREVLRFFKKRVGERGAQLQIDVFGEVSHGPSLHIGQDMKLFAPEIDAVCPMVYPSHYQPYRKHAQLPFETVYGSLTALKEQMGDSAVPVLAYIELFNHRFRMNVGERVQYIRAQLRAVRKAKAEGWLAWSAGNHYDLLFEILRRFRDRASS